MVNIGGHTPDAEEDQAFQAADILLGVPEVRKIIIVVVAAGIHAAAAVRHQPGLLGMDPVQQGLNGPVLKADIGDAGEQSLLNECVRLRSQQIGAALRSPG